MNKWRLAAGLVLYANGIFAQSGELADSVTRTNETLQPYLSTVSSLDYYPYTLNFTEQLSVATTGIRALSPSLPGMTNRLAIRGYSNMYHEQMPAVVVDGNLYTGSLSNLNPYMIEELKIIRNPFESSLPMSLTADGVIEIKTKRHRGDKKWYFNFNTNAGMVSRGVKDYDVITDPGMFYELMYTKYRNELYLSGMNWEDTKVKAANEFVAGYYLNNLYDVPNNELIDINTGKFNSNARRLYDDDIYGRFERKNGFRNQHNFIASRLFEKGNLNINAGYVKERSFIKTLDFDRVDLGLKGNWNLSGRWTVGFTASYAHQGISATETPYKSKQDVSPLAAYYARDNNGAIIKNSKGADSVSSLFSHWPVLLDAPKTTTTFSVHPYLVVHLFKSLNFKVNAGMNSDKIDQHKQYYRYNALSFGDNHLMRSMQYLSFNPSLNWYHNKGKHRWNAVVQWSHYRYKHTVDCHVNTPAVMLNITDGYGYQNNNLDFNSTYTFNNRIGINLRLNQERNVNNKNVIVPQKYQANNYALGINANIVNSNRGYLTLVADYVLQKNFIHFNHERAFSSLENALLYNNSSSSINFLPLAYFVPVETSQKTYQASLRASMFDHRLKFSAGYFVRNIYDARTYFNNQLMGYWYFSEGLNLLNSGYEFDIQSRVIDRSDFKWNVQLTGTHFANKLGGALAKMGGIAPFENKSINSMYLPEWGGVDPATGSNLLIRKDGTKTAATFVDFEDYKFFKGSDPVLWGSFGNSISWNKLSINILFNYSLGGQVYDQVYAMLSQSDRGAFSTYNVHKDLLESWTPEHRNTDIPVTTNYSTNNSFFMTNASWLSLKNVNISYDLPKHIFRNNFIDGVSAYIAGDNLLFLSKRQGLNPNAAFGPIALSTFPMTRTLMVGFNLNF